MFDVVAADAVDAVHRERAAVGHGHDGLGGGSQHEAHRESLIEGPSTGAEMMPRTPAATLPRMSDMRRIKHCRVCGAATQYRVPADDNRDRAICTACGEIHYENPLNVVGTVPVWGEQVLLCRRNIEPRYGFWTLPAGFMELGETTAEGAMRETVEEAGARIELQGLYTLLNVVRVGQVHLFYRARLLGHALRPGPGDHRGAAVPRARDALGQLAFRTVRETLQRFRTQVRFDLHAA
jgi:ADP-ribose pyrophosphatase YjhB (NUDIX family)